MHVTGGGDIEALEIRIRETSGKERAEALLEFAELRLSSDPAAAQERASAAVDLALELPPDSGRDALLVCALALRSRARHAEGEMESALRDADRAVAEARARGVDGGPLLDAVAARARILLRRGEADAAEAELREAIDAAEERGKSFALALNLLAGIRFQKDDLQGAVRGATEAAEILAAAGESRLETMIRGNLGHFAVRSGDEEGALACYVAAADCARGTGDFEGLGIMLHNIAQLELQRESYEEAVAAARECLEIRRGLRDRRGEVLTLAVLSRGRLGMGDPEAARRTAEQALELGGGTGAASALSQASGVRADALFELGRPDEAVEEALRGLAVARGSGNPHVLGQALLALGGLFVRAGRFAEAVGPLEEALECFGASEWEWETAATHEELGRALLGAGDPENACRHVMEFAEIVRAQRRRESRSRAEQIRVRNEVEQARFRAREAEWFAVRRSEARLREMIENTPNVGVFSCDEDGTIRSWNPAAERIFGYSREQAIGLPADALAADEAERARLVRAREDLLETGRPWGPAEWTFRRRTGETGTALSTRFLIADHERDRRIVGMDVDLSERVRAERAREESEAKFAKVFLASPDALAISDLETGRFLEVNASFERIFGHRREEAIGRSSLELRIWREPSDREVMRMAIREGRVCRQREVTFRRKSGELGVAELSAEPITLDGRTCVITSTHEITARKRAEQALEDAYAEVRRLRDRLAEENLYLREEIREEQGYGEILGDSLVMRQLRATVTRVAGTDATALVVGETGTGKELVARALHGLSSRRDRALVKVNCSAVSAGLVESELFGHERGAFTGAVQRRRGRFEIADRGTIFLDEIGELPEDTQVKFLRVLEEGEFERVGSSETIRVDVRVVAATNRDLERAVTEGRFRADLFYRLNVIPIRVPPLRERGDDVIELAAQFLGRVSRRLDRPLTGFTEEALDWMRRYRWPGNVRELRNFVERAAILSSSRVVPLPPGGMARTRPGAARGRDLESVAADHIRRILEECGWVIEGPAGAASALGLAPSTLRSRMRRLGIRRD